MARSRGLGVALAMPGVLLAVTTALAQKTEPAPQAAIAAVEKAGGKVVRDETVSDKPVMAINFGVSQVNDAGLETLKPFAGLKVLTLNNTKVTDAGLDQVKSLTSLEKLYLVDTGITDAGLARLKDLKKLRVLSLAGTKVTDACIDQIKGMGSVQEVFLAGTKVTDAGIMKLKEASPKLKIDR